MLKIYDSVYKILSSNPAARNSDKVLILEMWRMQDLHLTPDQQQKFMEVSSPESIRRARQKIQENGEFLADEKVQAKREELRQEVAGEAVAPKVEAKAISWLDKEDM